MQRTETPATARARQGKARCVYCGAYLNRDQANKWPGVCGSHADLPGRDPNYMAGLGGGRR